MTAARAAARGSAMRTIKPQFHGGVYLPSEKDQTLDAAVAVLPDPGFVLVPMRQHEGAAAVPCVLPGRRVLAGEPLGLAGADDSAAVHSPVSGKVCSLENVRLPDGGRCVAAAVESDGANQWAEHVNVSQDPADFTPANFAERFAALGLVQMQPRGQPLHRRIQLARDASVDTLVVNAMESEPYLTADHRLTVEQSLLVALGTAHLCRLIGAERGVVAVDHRRNEEAELLDGLLTEHGAELKLDLGAVCLDHLYPQGHELMLLKTLFDQEVEVRAGDAGGERATDRAGVCVLDISAVAAAADAMLFNRPLVHRVVTVSGDAVARPGNLFVPIGVRIADVLAHAGAAAVVDRLIVGGPMTGIAQPDDQSVLTKQSAGLVAFAAAMLHQPGPCIRCGWCVEDCPVGINPALLADAAEAQRPDRRARSTAHLCIECNICSYVCPARLPLRERIGLLKRAAWRKGSL